MVIFVSLVSKFHYNKNTSFQKEDITGIKKKIRTLQQTPAFSKFERTECEL